MHAAAVMNRMLWWKKVAIPALPCKPLLLYSDALVQEGCAIPALPFAAAVVIHRILGRRCYPCAAMQARCCSDPQNAPWKKLCYPCAAMQARCCWISQNALVQEGCAIPALSHASCCHDPQNALVEGCAIPALPCKQAAVMIHRMWWKKVLRLRCHASSLL
jgi:hypothetical protein